MYSGIGGGGGKKIQCEAASKPMGYCENIHGLVMVPTQTVWCKTISDLRG